MELKGKKVIFSREDTLSLDYALSPIIVAGLKKFLEVLEEQKADSDNSSFGIPVSVLKGNGPKFTEAELEDGVDEWFTIIEKMIYAFEAEEPIMSENIAMMSISDMANEDGNSPIVEEILDQGAYDEHYADVKLHDDSVKEGLALFAKHYNNLWW